MIKSNNKVFDANSNFLFNLVPPVRSEPEDNLTRFANLKKREIPTYRGSYWVVMSLLFDKTSLIKIIS